jgi:hypothetical protein
MPRRRSPTLCDHRGAMPHAQLSRQGANDYVAQLQPLAAGQGHLAVAVRALVDSTMASLQHGPNLTVLSVPFHAGLLTAVVPDERRLLLNPWLPGYGSPAAKFAFVGTAHAFDSGGKRVGRGPRYESCLALNCALPLLWLADGGGSTAEVAARIVGTRHCHQRYEAQRHPNEYLFPVSSGHTWPRLTRVLTAAGRSSARCAGWLWGANAYLFELSDRPSAQQVNEALPTLERRQFLPRLLSALVGARALVFYGQWRQPDWDRIRYVLASQFLGINADPAIGARWQTTPDYRAITAGVPKTDSARIVIIMQSPTRRGPTNAFLDAVGGAIGQHIA